MAETRRISGTLSSNTNSAQFFFTGRVALSGFYLHLSGTFGGGTVNVQFQGADGTWRNLTGVSKSAAADNFIFVPNETNYRLNLSGATSPSIYYQISADGPSGFRT